MIALFEQLSRRPRRGSALILTVVLTSLLAVVGVLFVMAARIDKMASSATSDNRDLALAVDTVLAQVNEDLMADVPGRTQGQEYYDYPDANNAWLADLEPYKSGSSYYWRQISNVAGLVTGSTRDALIHVLEERAAVDATMAGTNADADGDGVGDARWFQLPGDTSSKGKPIWAAVRIIDNGGMLNVNTGYKFDPQNRVDGSRQLHVNVLALACGPGSDPNAQNDDALVAARANYIASPTGQALANYLDDYEKRVTWRYLDVARSWDSNAPYSYTPFDSSDELELRYRFLLNQSDLATRVESWGWFAPKNTKSTPVDSGGKVLDQWFLRAAPDPGTGALDPNYAYRHIATTYNMDRILTPKPVATPDGTQLRRMLNVNVVGDKNYLRAVVKAALEEASPGRNMDVEATQITVNLLDYIDDDDKVTVMPGVTTSQYYGFERPCIYISEVAYREVKNPRTGEIHQSYAIELYKPYFEDSDPGGDLDKSDEWRISIPGNPVRTITWRGSGTRRFQVLLAEDPDASLKKDYVGFSDTDPTNAMQQYEYNPADYNRQEQNIRDLTFKARDTIRLERRAEVSYWLPVDWVSVPDGLMVGDGTARSVQRDISQYRCIWRRWGPAGAIATPTLGNGTGHFVDNTRPEIQAHPANKTLTNIGELGMLFVKNAYSLSGDELAAEVLVDLTLPAYQRLFNYLTVIDPAEHPIDPAEHIVADPNKPPETRIMGRININTAPWFVLAQLPWMQYDPNAPGSRSMESAKEVVRYRDTQGAYRSIGELMRVQRLLRPGADRRDNEHVAPSWGPDLTSDTILDDFEERDLLFTRISNLVTVRSDAFTAYILVRLGPNGPQKRVVAILDRSPVTVAGGKVRIVAQQLVPDPR